MPSYKEVNGDLWPARDAVCNRVAYNFDGAKAAIRHCKKLDLVVQAGGCVGAWPRYLATHFKQVVTFEPSPENHLLLLKNLALEERIKAYPAALGVLTGVCGIKINPKNCGDDQTSPGDWVKVWALDDLWLAPDLIYLDIQGDERSALLGARQTIERCSPVIGIEVDNKLSRKGDAVGLLESWGYRLVGKAHQDRIFAR